MRIPSDTLKIRDSIIYNPNVKNDLKIACIGDFHLSKIVGEKDIYNISKSLDKEQPDYICMLGDIVDTPFELLKHEKLNELDILLKNSANIAKTLVILGSHDYVNEDKNGYEDMFSDNIWNSYNDYNNVSVLNDATYEDDNIFFGGYRQKMDAYYSLMDKKIENSKSYYEDLSKKLELIKDLPKDKPTIFLTHSPEPIHDKINQELLKKYDLIITGHYHNGGVPSIIDDIFEKSYSGFITPRKKFLPKEARGIVKLETGTYLVYNGGWTKIQDCAPKIIQPLDKFYNRQMDVITLTSNPKLKNNEIKINNRKMKLSLINTK